MKKIALTLFSLVFAITLLAQQAPPQGINYQAMVYVPYGNQQVGVNSAGQIPANTKQVVVKFTLEEGNNGPVIYEETQNEVTDQYGLLNAVIGIGTPTSNSPGLFNQIDWSLGDPYLRVSITLTQYNSTVSSYQKLWSVPYALYANQANSANTADYATNSGHADSSDYADLAGNGITGVIDNGNGTLTFTYLDGSTYTTPVLTGLMGTPGPQGPAGQNGQSAYDIWLAQGNTGTQQDFLNSLQGATGLTGPQGSVGSTGPQGTAGQNGNNGQSAYDIWLAQGNTGTQQDFLNSLQGATGPQGPIGTGSFTHYIGEEFGGGVIFHLWKDNSGVEHGLVVDKTDLSTAQVWSNINQSLIGPAAQSSWDGLSNSNAIFGQSGHTSSATALCLNSTNGGQIDWYLPSIDELSLLWHNRFNVNKSLSTIGGAMVMPLFGFYWSSTEYNDQAAWFFDFYGGAAPFSSANKNFTGYVRAVRAF
jgi:hypothetical protein